MPDQQKHFSFLLGSGFSVPDGYPTTSQLNESLQKINADEISIHTDMTARFLNGEVDINPWSRQNEKLFVQRFLEFYNEKILEGKPFNYEEFYDFYNELRKTEQLDDKCNKFFDDFKKESGLEYDHYNFLMNFNYTFNQLVFRLLLKKWPEPIGLSKPYQPEYREFLELLDELGKESRVHIHSLNHDLLMERFFSTDTLANKISDGFEELGSPFYGQHLNYKNNPSYKYIVRLKRFTNEYFKNFCLYKLHGSVDTYVFNFENKEYTMIKLPYGVQRNNLMKEILNNKGQRVYYEDLFQVMPDFLSGTSTKVLSYDRKVYYKPLFKHFKKNLQKSDRLIVIGYGFGDAKINDYLRDNFLSDESKRMVVIDIQKPECELMGFPNVRFIEKSISDVTRAEIFEKLK